MSLREFLDKAQSELFDEFGAFFAFSDAQFNEKKKEGIDYASAGAGLLVPKDRLQEFYDRHDKIVEVGIAQDVEKNGIEKIIKRELANYECYYTGSIDDCVEALEDYPCTKEDILAIYNKTKRKRA